MKKQPAKEQQKIQLRDVSVAEAIAMAVFRRRKMIERGKTSRRVVIPLPSHLIPPQSGEYNVAIGRVKITSLFKQEEGRWIMVVRLPADEGFELKDHLRANEKHPKSQQPSTQLTPEEVAELQKTIENLWAK
jgi:hypothetical protein